MSPSTEPYNEEKYKALMDGLECTTQSLSQVLASGSRFDADYYSKMNLSVSKILNTVGNKTIGEYGGILDCSAFYPAITGYYSHDRNNIPFLRVNEINNGLILITDETVFLPESVIEENSKTIAKAYPGDIIIAKGGNTLAKVGLITDEFPVYATCRDVIILRTDKLDGINKYFLWAFLHSSYGQSILWRSASQTGQPHLTLPAITKINVPNTSLIQKAIEMLYQKSVGLKEQSSNQYSYAESILSEALDLQSLEIDPTNVSIKPLSISYGISGRLDAEYYQPKYDDLFSILQNYPCKNLGGNNGITDIIKSIEPGSEAYQKTGIPFIRVSDLDRFGISQPEIYLSSDIVEDVQTLYPRKNTILFSKDGSVGIAYKMEENAQLITSGALLHLTIRDTDTVLPDYLTLVLNSPVVQMQAERDSNGAIIQHWKPSEIANVIIPILDMSIQQEIANKVQESFALRKQSKVLLEYAKKAVEMAIEQGEDTALAWLKEKVNV